MTITMIIQQCNKNEEKEINNMKNFLDTILQGLVFIKDNWTLIVTVIGLVIAIAVKVKNYIKLSKQEKIDLALVNLKSVALALVTELAERYDENMVKRSAFFKYVVENYPSLADNLEDLVDSIDDIIDDALKVLKKQETGEKVTKSEALLIQDTKETEIEIVEEYETITKEDIENIVKDVLAKENTSEVTVNVDTVTNNLVDKVKKEIEKDNSLSK